MNRYVAGLAGFLILVIWSPLVAADGCLAPMAPKGVSFSNFCDGDVVPSDGFVFHGAAQDVPAAGYAVLIDWRDDRPATQIGSISSSKWTVAWNATGALDGAFSLLLSAPDWPAARVLASGYKGTPAYQVLEPESWLVVASWYMQSDATVETGTVTADASGWFSGDFRPRQVAMIVRFDGETAAVYNQTVSGVAPDDARRFHLTAPAKAHFDGRGKVGNHTATLELVFHRDTHAESRIMLPAQAFQVDPVPEGHPATNEPAGRFWEGSSSAAPTLSPAAVTAGGLTLGLLVAAAFAEPARYGVLGLFSRLRSDRLLDQKTRRHVHEVIAANPGIHFRALGRQTGLANGTVVHHVRQLEAFGLVRRRRVGRYVRFYLPDVANASTVELSGAQQRVLTGILAGSSAAALGRELQVSRQAIHGHVKRLADAGVVQRIDGAWTRGEAPCRCAACQQPIQGQPCGCGPQQVDS